MLLVGALFAFNAHAEMSSDDLTLADEAIQAPQMDIEGQYKTREEVVKATPVAVKEEKKEEKKAEIVAPKKVQRRISQSDRLKMYRERLEERNRIMIERKMEQIRYRQELALARQLEQSMNKTLNAIDSIKN